MEPYNLDDFCKEIDSIEDLISFLSANEADISIYGLSFFSKKEEIEEHLPKLDAFPKNKIDFLRIARIIDSTTHQEAIDTLEKYGIEKTILKLAVKIKVAKKKKAMNGVNYQMASFLRAFRFTAGFARKSEFSSTDNSIDLEETLAGLAIFRTQVRSVYDTYFRNMRMDDTIFTPSNINIQLVSTHIQQSITIIESASSIPDEDKNKLLEYLKDIKDELSTSRPAWKKIVGGLVIVSAIIGGAANLPDAAENVNKAYEHIMGTSVKIHSPIFSEPKHNLLPKPEDKKKEESPDESGDIDDFDFENEIV